MVHKYRGVVRTNAETRKDVSMAMKFGADGIGLVRTEHMFFNDTKPGQDRLYKFQKAIITNQMDAVFALKEFQKEDFKTIYRLLNGLPGTVRLADPPLHEFLPDTNDWKIKAYVIQLGEIGDVMEALDVLKNTYPDYFNKHPETERTIRDLVREDSITEAEKVLIQTVRKIDLTDGEKVIKKLSQDLKVSETEIVSRIEAKREKNPMAGNRGGRALGIMNPEVYDMQVRSIFEAQLELIEEGVKVAPAEIMIPLINNLEEFRFFEDRYIKIADKYGLVRGKDYFIGNMLETPAAALDADRIATRSDFFSIGSNDLTQFTFFFSRDDAGNVVIPRYIEDEILPGNSFESIDPAVGELIAIGAAKGNKTMAEIGKILKIGNCGEHGGEPNSITNYLVPAGVYPSASPYRVAVAQLTSAQANIRREKEGNPDTTYNLSKIAVESVSIAPERVYKTEDMMMGKNLEGNNAMDRLNLTRRVVISMTPRGPLARRIKPDFMHIFQGNTNPLIRLFNLDLKTLFQSSKEELFDELKNEWVRDLIEQFEKKVHEWSDEKNPDLANRGVRQMSVGRDRIVSAQLMAIFSAMQENNSYHPRIIIPLLVAPKEFSNARKLIDKIAKEYNISPDRYSVGAEIATPRAALLAGDIVEAGADFIAFDTMTLTESAYAFTVADAKEFLEKYVELGIFKDNPLDVLPPKTIELIGIAEKRAKEINPKIPVHYYGQNAVAGIYPGNNIVASSPIQNISAQLEAVKYLQDYIRQIGGSENFVIDEISEDANGNPTTPEPAIVLRRYNSLVSVNEKASIEKGTIPVARSLAEKLKLKLIIGAETEGDNKYEFIKQDRLIALGVKENRPGLKPGAALLIAVRGIESELNALKYGTGRRLGCYL